jgi:hypothetical protein
MGIPTPTVPVFTDGQIVHASDLNGLGSNITNLYNYLNAGFTTQRPLVIVNTTSTQSAANNAYTTINFQSGAVNTDNMWTASLPNTVTINHAGIYWIFGQIRCPNIATSGVAGNIMVNGTAFTNSKSTNIQTPSPSGFTGPTPQMGLMANLAAGSVLYLAIYQNTGGSITLQTDFGGSYLGAVFLSPSV